MRVAIRLSRQACGPVCFGGVATKRSRRSFAPSRFRCRGLELTSLTGRPSALSYPRPVLGAGGVIPKALDLETVGR